MYCIYVYIDIAYLAGWTSIHQQNIGQIGSGLGQSEAKRGVPTLFRPLSEIPRRRWNGSGHCGYTSTTIIDNSWSWILGFPCMGVPPNRPFSLGIPLWIVSQPAIGVCPINGNTHFIWLVVWNMTFIFPYIGNTHPNWLSYFSEGFKPPTSIP